METRISESLSDPELVLLARQGNLLAFEEIARRHGPRVYSLAMRMLRHPQDAEDITQQTFLSAIEALPQFRGESSVLTWLLRIASHAALKVIRKRKGLATVSLEESTESPDPYSTVPHPEYIADWQHSPETLVSRRETQQLMDAALATLEDKHRLVFLLRDVQGLSIRETAEALGLTEANTKVRLLRARLQLREQLTQVLGDPGTRVHRGHHSHED